MDPREADEPVRSRAMAARGSEYLVWNFQVDRAARFSFARDAQLVRWAEGLGRDYHRRRWTGKYANWFAAAVHEASRQYLVRVRGPGESGAPLDAAAPLDGLDLRGTPDAAATDGAPPGDAATDAAPLDGWTQLL